MSHMVAHIVKKHCVKQLNGLILIAHYKHHRQILLHVVHILIPLLYDRSVNHMACGARPACQI